MIWPICHIIYISWVVRQFWAMSNSFETCLLDYARQAQGLGKIVKLDKKPFNGH